MSAEIINLRKARKAKQRRDAAARAEENRAKFGRTKAEREATERGEGPRSAALGLAAPPARRRGAGRVMPAGDRHATMQRNTRPLKRSFAIKGHRTSISMEAPFWEALQQAAALENSTLSGLVASIDAARGDAGLSSAVRVWILDYFRKRSMPTPG